MHYSREDGKWQFGKQAGLLSELRKRMSAFDRRDDPSDDDIRDAVSDL